MGNQTQIQPLSSNSIYDDHLNYPGDHTFDPLFESDPDLNALLTENGLVQNIKYFTIADILTKIFPKVAIH